VLVLVPVLVYIVIITFVYGVVTVRLFDRLLGSPSVTGVPLPLVHIVGLVALAILSGYLSLLIPVALLANIIVITLAIVLSFAQ
jgi:hypothetical protein